MAVLPAAGRLAASLTSMPTRLDVSSAFHGGFRAAGRAAAVSAARGRGAGLRNWPWPRMGSRLASLRGSLVHLRWHQPLAVAIVMHNSLEKETIETELLVGWWKQGEMMRVGWSRVATPNSPNGAAGE